MWAESIALPKILDGLKTWRMPKTLKIVKNLDLLSDLAHFLTQVGRARAKLGGLEPRDWARLELGGLKPFASPRRYGKKPIFRHHWSKPIFSSRALIKVGLFPDYVGLCETVFSTMVAISVDTDHKLVRTNRPLTAVSPLVLQRKSLNLYGHCQCP